MQDSNEYSVSEVARRFKVSDDTIRRYEAQGVYAARRIFNQRVLTDADIAAIAAIRKLIKK